jgi:xanthine dehydrogenase accessory factor
VTTAGIYARMAELSEAGAPFVLVTIVRTEGSSPRAVGASMLVTADGNVMGTIGGGVLEQQATADALRHLQGRVSRTQEYRLTPVGDHAIGARCGGEVTVFFDTHPAARSLLIIGAGHIGKQLSAFAALLDFRIVVIDSRRDMVTRERFPAASELFCADGGWSPELCEIADNTSVVIATHSAEHDRDALRSVVRSGAGYVGMIGSKRKIASVFDELTRGGIEREALELVHAPIGLDIGAETPAELALCIMAEVVAVASRQGPEEGAEQEGQLPQSRDALGEHA